MFIILAGQGCSGYHRITEDERRAFIST